MTFDTTKFVLCQREGKWGGGAGGGGGWGGGGRKALEI